MKRSTRKAEVALILAAIVATLTLMWVALGAENDRERLNDANDTIAELESRPIPTKTVTKRVTPPPPPPTTIYVTVTPRTVDRASRSEAKRTPNRTRISNSSPLTGWKADYWRKAQDWATWPKTRAVIECESSNRVTAVSSTGKYRGLYQMDKGKWASYGGLELAPRPDLATRAEQNYVAYRIYVGNGWSPWECA